MRIMNGANNSMRILVCGGTEFDDWAKLAEVLHPLLTPHCVVIEGGAKGADFLARVYAKWCNIPFEEYPAEWKKYGRAAGGIRNQRMLDEGRPDLVVAFPGGTGTANMVRRAKRAGVKVHEVS